MKIRQTIQEISSFLAECGIEAPRLTAELLLAHVLKKKRLDLYLDAEGEVRDDQLVLVRELAQRRTAGEPIQYITGVVEFCGLDILVDPRVLIPRPETELLVEAVTQRLCRPTFRTQSTAPRILDLCTGSGCIAVALATKLPEARITAVDISADALDLALQNAQRQRVSAAVEFLQGDLFGPLPKGSRFHVIVSNPPYVAESEFGSLEREIREHEPRAALIGGPSGLEVIEKIVRQAPRYLVTSGLLALEIGFDQCGQVNQFLDEHDFKEVEFVRDLRGHSRVVVARKSD